MNPEDFKKVKRYGRRKLECNFSSGIVLHYDYPVNSKDPLKKNEWLNRDCHKIGVSMNGRMYFTREEWVSFFNAGLQILELGEK